MKTVGVIGLGLIGGSMALDLRRRGFASKVLGVEADSVAAEAALTIGLVDKVVDLKECVKEADIIVLAVPVGTAVKMVPEILDGLEDDKIVIDVCSTKEEICRAVKYHPRRKQFVSTHPMAGTEYSGPGRRSPGSSTAGPASLRTRRNRPPKQLRS